MLITQEKLRYFRACRIFLRMKNIFFRPKVQENAAV